MAFERSESIVKSVRPYTLLTANFGKTKISLLLTRRSGGIPQNRVCGNKLEVKQIYSGCIFV